MVRVRAKLRAAARLVVRGKRAVAQSLATRLNLTLVMMWPFCHLAQCLIALRMSLI